MFYLSNATAKGRMNTAGCTKLAVFFLFCLFIFSGCPANASDNDDIKFPFVKDGSLYSFCSAADDSSLIKSYEISGASEGYTQRAVSLAKKDGFILAWNQKSQNLYYINPEGHTSSKVKLSGSIAYVGKNYVLMQTSSFDQNKGFPFTLYSIKYTRAGKKISLKKIWYGNIDCFVSDSFFTSDGICICGGNKDNTKHNVYYITAKGIHKCFTTDKNSDFLRILNTKDKVYAFLSGREKTKVEPVLFSFTLDGYTEGADSCDSLSFYISSIFSPDFECFFGYGFVSTNPEVLVIPASFDGQISFVCYDYKIGRVYSVIPDATGCLAVLGTTSEGTWYLARDPLIEGSFNGISLFTGSECKKIKEIY